MGNEVRRQIVLGSILIRWPIIAISEGDILVFESSDRVSWMEPTDVRNGEYCGAWDRDGRLLAISVQRESRRTLLGTREFDSTVVDEIPGSPPSDPRLVEEILKRLPGYNLAEEVDEKNGPALIECVLRHIEPT